MNVEKELLLKKLKKLKLNQWENYFQFVENPDNYKETCQTLSIGSIDRLVSAEYANLFQYLPEY